MLVAFSLFAAQARARVTRIVIDERQSPTYDGRVFGAAGAYEKITGHAFGELDPQDPHNTIINDLDLAPRNARGKVEYVATFSLWKPVDLAKASGILIYGVPNRGNRILMSAFNVGGDPGDGFFFNRGDIILYSGWQGDVAQRPGAETIVVPIAKSPDGSSITGPAFARFVNTPAGTVTLALPATQAAAILDTTQAVLTCRASEDGAVVPIAPADWAFADCRSAPFPGVADPTRISLKHGFDPGLLFELSYTTKDPLVLGVGLAATRDICSFFRRAATDDNGTANPLSGKVSHVVAQGISQAGNFVKTFIHLGFNQDESGRIVWDGANDHIAGRQLPINFRFARPGGAAALYEPGSEGVLWWGEYEDTVRGRKSASLLDRSRASNTIPKIFETFGSTEFWGLRMSPGLVGTKADQDIPLPANVRRYYFPGTTHGGGRGGFTSEARPSGAYELPDNPNPQLETMRALLIALIDWVAKDDQPPASKYPLFAEGQLVRPNHRAMGFPVIPGNPFPDNLLNPFFDYDLGPGFNYNDMSGRMASQPPEIKRVIPSLVPKVDSDGNETAGIPSVLHQAPLGTYLGWNVASSGFYKDHASGFSGGYVPFARTKAAREASGDPRRALEERYHDHDGYVAAVTAATQRLVQERFLLAADADRLIQQAQASAVLR
ncbi:MAG TPA: alpha/beta hydrolase domain-containing protein [Humisphaera sp.]|nr:alpha/beta hydrolase domain-containing protein [Humisphaera sp.]